ncbi:MAG: hypothetical protein OER97_08825 [Gammaproteobacteria bacterium]|nr:hypothetical protein [Gammaproteobacteria bacterium]
MIDFFKKWIRRKEERPAPLAIGERRRSPRSTAVQETAPPERRHRSDRRTAGKLDPHVAGKIESSGPGKNVLVRNKYQREDTGTHETLKILDGSATESDEETGIDPYNTGNFDRSKNWDKRFRN